MCLIIVLLHTVYMCVCSYAKRGDDLPKDKNIKSQSFSQRRERSHFFSRPLAAYLASFISISLLPTQLLKLQHLLGLFHFISNGLAFTVCDRGKENKLKKNQSFENGFSARLQCLMLC